MMRAELKSLYSPDADPLKDFAPAGPFGILVMAMIGPAGQQGHESFDFMLCTPEWFASNIREDFKMGRHYLFVRDFDYMQLERFVREYCGSCAEAPQKSWLVSENGNLRTTFNIGRHHPRGRAAA
jgi:Immunity protein 8